MPSTCAATTPTRAYAMPAPVVLALRTIETDMWAELYADFA